MNRWMDISRRLFWGSDFVVGGVERTGLLLISSYGDGKVR